MLHKKLRARSALAAKQLPNLLRRPPRRNQTKKEKGQRKRAQELDTKLRMLGICVVLMKTT